MTTKVSDPRPNGVLSLPTIQTLEEKNLGLCSEEEHETVKLDLLPGHTYEKGELKRLVEKSGPTMKQVFTQLQSNAEVYNAQPELKNAVVKTAGDVSCVRYQPLESVDGKPAEVANCVQHVCTFAERE